MAMSSSRFSLTIRAKIILTNVLLLVLLGGSLWYLRVNIERGGDAVRTQRMVLEGLEKTNRASKAFGDLRFWLSDFAVSQLNESEEQAKQAHQELERHLEALRASEPQRVAEIRQHGSQLWTAMQEAVKAYLDDNRVLGNSLVAQSRLSAEAASRLMQAIISERQKQAEMAGEAVLESGERSLKLSLTLLIISMVVGSCLSWMTVRSITRPIVKMSSVVRSMAKGDLTAQMEATGKDEITLMGRELNEAIRQIGQLVQQVRDSASHMASGSQQLSAATEELTSGAQEQASSLEETAASLEQITGTVKQNADNARQANQLSMASRDIAEKGGQVVTAAVSSMGEINKSSKKIAAIITTIDEIAFQTNLLALNAAVEAARAGEQGRGFAVVAAEVRNLAQRSATAAKEIKTLIQDSVQKVQEGSELVNRSGQTLEEIVTAVKRVTDIIAEIAAAGQEQSQGIEQVSKAVTQMDQVVQANSAQTEELTSTAQALATQAEELQALVGRFKLDHETATRGTVAASPAPQAVARPMVKAMAARAMPTRAESVLAGTVAGGGAARGR